ncbi:MAG: cytochrome c biogenesis protein CcdA [Anaerolineae bacterium]|nr:cytochrome c biogenesis protein CcdA [Thermoflexales bacterium]HQW35144.1 cytochrome c biogenesis protein CcdA [Thermoflexales bacterium]
MLEAFLLGNAAILGNVCMLPLYPGLLAFLAGTAQGDARPRSAAWLGALVLAGVLSMMIALGFALYALNQAFSNILPVLLPIIYAIVIVLGLAMVFGFNPFSRLAMAQTPALRSRPLTAFVYGMLLAPMTLPCTGPLIIGAFVLGAGNAATLANSLLYFFSFGLGFGWPLIALSLIAAPLQRKCSSWFTARHSLIGRLSGALLIAIGLLGIWTDFVR